jgi:hypothetical protein
MSLIDTSILVLLEVRMGGPVFIPDRLSGTAY